MPLPQYLPLPRPGNMKMLKLSPDGDSIVLGSSISVIKVVHRQGTEYYMAGPRHDNNTDHLMDTAHLLDTSCWTMLSNGNGVLPVTVGNVISENVENEIRMALKAGLESMGVDTKGMLRSDYPHKPSKPYNPNNTTTCGNTNANYQGNYNNNKCMNNLNLNNKLDVIAENENNEKMVS